MAKPKTRRIAAGLGWAMLAVFLTTFGIRFYNLATHHSPELDGVMIASGIFLVAASAFWFFTKDDPDTSAKEFLSQTTHGNDSPAVLATQGGIGVGGDVAGSRLFTAEHLTYHEAAPPAPLPPEIQMAKLDFDVKADWVWLVYENTLGYWRRSVPSDSTPRRSFIVYFTRNEPAKGEKTITAVSLVGILKLTNSMGSEKVSRAYWLGRTNNQIDFEAGHQEALIVGSCEGPLFSSYLNKFSFDWSNEVGKPRGRVLGDRKFMYTTDPISVKISLFDVYANRTVEERRFEISICGPTVGALEVKIT